MVGEAESSLAGLRADLLYVIVFGPGFGESIILRVPPDCWVVIDGCQVGASSYPARLLAEHDARWSCVVLTHPHDDHVLGLDAVLDRPGGPVVGCVAPVVEDPYLWMRSPDPERHFVSGTKEHVLAAIQDRWETIEGARWELRRGEKRRFCGADFTVLHPNDPTLRAFYAAVRQGYRFDENLLSTPLLVDWKRVRVLLGADLPARAWDSVGSEFIHLDVHHVLKVPHHGSREALSPVYLGRVGSGRERIWVVTPFNRGRRLPVFGDGEAIAHMLEYVDVVHLTSLPVPRGFQGRTSCRKTRMEVIEILDSAARGESPAGSTTAVEPGEGVDCWVAVGLDEAGHLVDLRHGPGSIVVREGLHA